MATEQDPLLAPDSKGGEGRGAEEMRVKDHGFVASAPQHLRTQRQRWLSLLGATVACALASGPVAAWPTLEPLLIKGGLFEGEDQKSNLDFCYSLSIAAQLLGSLPAGWMYDRLGPRKCSVIGAGVAGTGLVLMATAVSFPATFSFVMLFGYPMAMFGGQINTFGLYSWIWLLPNDQNFIASVASGVQNLSDMLALVAVGLDACCGLNIGIFFLSLSGLCVICGLICTWLIPTKEVTYLFVGLTLGEEAQPPAAKDDRCLGTEIDLTKRSWKVMRQHSGANGLLLTFSTVYILSILYPIQQMLFYYKALFADADTATELVNIYAVMYGLGGFASSLVGGKLCDKVGIRRFTMLVAGCSLMVSILLPLKSFTAQILAQIFLTLGFSLYFIVVNRFSMLYASADLFGTLGGVQFTIISVGMSIGMQLVSLGVEELGSVGPVMKYQVTYVCLGLGSSVLGLALAYYWGKHPPPAVGGAAEESEAEGYGIIDTDP